MAKIYVVDFETYYDSEYSLSKMTMEEYIRDDRFQVIGVSIGTVDGEKIKWIPGTEDIARYLRGLAGQHIVAHNALFDAAILVWHYGIRPKLAFDTRSLAAPILGKVLSSLSLRSVCAHLGLGDKGTTVYDMKGRTLESLTPEELQEYGEYCLKDVRLCTRLFDYERKLLPASELALNGLTTMLFADPVLRLDRETLDTAVDDIEEELERLKRSFHAAVQSIGLPNTTWQDLNSNDKFAAMLRAAGLENPPTKISKTTGKTTWAFSKQDPEFTALTRSDTPAVSVLVKCRLAAKGTQEANRVQRLRGIAARTLEALLPVPLQYCGAFNTWRWSGTDKINLQNLNRGSKLRQAIVAPPGHVLVVGDSSNIELRVNHCLAGCVRTVEALLRGEDLYCQFATELYGRPITKADKDERQVGKAAQLGLGFGMGWRRFLEYCLQMGIPMTEDEARRVVSLWRSMYPEVVELWHRASNALYVMAVTKQRQAVDPAGLVTTGPYRLMTPGGRWLSYPKLRKDDDGNWVYFNRNKWVKIFGGALVENIVQHLARHIVAEQWLRIVGTHGWRMALPVHDELVFVVPEDEAEKAAEVVEKEMSTPPQWWPSIPLAAEVSIAKRYGDAK